MYEKFSILNTDYLHIVNEGQYDDLLFDESLLV